MDLLVAPLYRTEEQLPEAAGIFRNATGFFRNLPYGSTDGPPIAAARSEGPASAFSPAAGTFMLMSTTLEDAILKLCNQCRLQHACGLISVSKIGIGEV
jgi:hypothetical protein